MGFKLSMLTAAALVSVPMIASAQSSYGSSGSSQNAAPADAQEGLTPAQAASKRGSEAKGKDSAKADTKAEASASADVKAGASVYDAQGNVVGKVESVDGKGAVLNTGKVKAKVPLSSLSRNDKGLVIGMSASEIEAAAKAK